MDYYVTNILKKAFIKLTVIAEKRELGDITHDQAREQINNITQDAISEISQRLRLSFITDN